MAKSTEVILCPTVPAPRSGTAGQTGKTGTGHGTSAGQASLKSLANRVLGRDKVWDKERDSLSHLSSEKIEGWDKISGPSETVETDSFEERAAIVEIDGALPREWAEGLARLDCMPCPDSVHPERWAEVVNDAGRFADAWAAKAVALGWNVLDVFGVHPGKPDARFDRMGLVWLLRGKRILAISEDAAKLETSKGYQTFRRVARPEGVALWELSP